MKTKSLILVVLCAFLQMNLAVNSAYSQEGKGGKGPPHHVTGTDGIQETVNIPGSDEPTPPVTNVVVQPNPVITNPPPPVNPQPQPQPGKTHVQSTGPGSSQPVNPGKTQVRSTSTGSAQPVTNTQPLINTTTGKTNLNSTGPGAVAPVAADAVEASGKVQAPALIETTPSAQSTAVLPSVPMPEYVPSANPTKDPCEDKAMAEIYKLLIADNNNVLGIMFELTAMRLAKRTLEQEPTYSTFEDLTVTNIKTLNDQMVKLDKDSVIQDKVRKVYEVYGKKQDEKVVSDRLADLKRDAKDAVNRAKDACYFDKETRFRNNESSAFIMASVIGEGGDLSASTKDNPAKLTDIDAATIWVVERARQEAADRLPHDKNGYQIGAKNGNMLNVSTRVTRYLGRIADGRQKLTPAMMDELIKKEQDQMKEIVKSIYEDTKEGAKNHIREKLIACLQAEPVNKNCDDCVKKRMTALETVNLDIDNIQRGLLQSVSKAENLKFENGLQASLGPVYIDFHSLNTPNTNVSVQTGKSGQDIGHDFASAKDATATEGVVPHLPPRGTKENCKKFWVKKSGRKHGSHVAKTKSTDSETGVAPAPASVPPATATEQPVTPPPASTQPAAVSVPVAAVPASAPKTTGKAKPSAKGPPVEAAVLANPPSQVPGPGSESNAALAQYHQQNVDVAKNLQQNLDELNKPKQQSAIAAQGADPRRSSGKAARKVAADTDAPSPAEKAFMDALNKATVQAPAPFGKCKISFSDDRKTIVITKDGKPESTPISLSSATADTDLAAAGDTKRCDFHPAP